MMLFGIIHTRQLRCCLGGCLILVFASGTCKAERLHPSSNPFFLIPSTYTADSIVPIDEGISIGELNDVRRAAQEALEEKNYAQAIKHYDELLRHGPKDKASVLLNRAHAQFFSKNTEAALRDYQSVLGESQDPLMRSTAFNQIGLLSDGKVEDKTLLGFFKKALKESPNNQAARYNYQRVLQRTKEKKDQQGDKDKKQDQQGDKDKKQDQQGDKDKKQGQQGDKDKKQGQQGDKDKKQGQQGDKDKKQGQQGDKDKKQGQQGDKDKKQGQQGNKDKKQEQQGEQGSAKEGAKSGKEEQGNVSERLRAINMSEHKARQILEALRQQEAQYLQQLRRKPQKPRDKSKPDW